MLLCGVLYLGCIARYKVKSSGSELLVGWLQLWMASGLDGFRFGWLQVWLASGFQDEGADPEKREGAHVPLPQ